MSNSTRKQGAVVILPNKGDGRETGHESAAQQTLARRIADLKEWAFAGRYDPACNYGCPVYFVPGDTITSLARAQSLGIRGEHDLFGGVVPFAHVATKTITHPLAGDDAEAPDGWCGDFAASVADVVLPGISAFSLADASLAGSALLQHGAVRIKLADGIGGAGQTVARDAAQLEEQLQAVAAAGGFAGGVVLERNLNDVQTLSVGQVRIGDQLASYYGNQRLTRNNAGEQVYGGSDLVVVRGGYDTLLGLDLPSEIALAVRQAHVYHEAALKCFAGMIVSRSNYDIAQGRDCEGVWRSGVLEQSWRAGGASGAEIAALEAFRADPALRTVRASTVEVYGDGQAVPDDAVVYYRGQDEQVGALAKYTRLSIDAHS
ncbi:DUF3182 family protein [Noviherbaspirillum aridicola]|uniref:Biotin carboxylase n=1 Tax=Noviherbaspirillum aridicola TaxID=2849687 RepID=A0ABQ4Q461_9BURK|nr:DUF3182 family protein [Noviherbaspirillum aridicola]GIZ51544.1 hypothetical protein NCCP691_15580 [Noviherbaspirillum aridicola]